MMPKLREIVAYRAMAGTGVYDAEVLAIDETIDFVMVALDIIVPGTGARVRRTRVLWSNDPGCTADGTAHPKQISA